MDIYSIDKAQSSATNHPQAQGPKRGLKECDVPFPAGLPPEWKYRTEVPQLSHPFHH